MKIAIFETEAWERPSFERLGSQHEIIFADAALRQGNAAEFSEAEVLSPFVYSDLSRPVLEQLPHLQLISTRSTGVDHIDRVYCQEHGITVCNVPSYGENTVAEHVFALLLTISHHMFEAIDRTRRGDFSMQGLRGFDLQGKTFGAIGTGAIGRHAVRIARGFGMNVVAYDVQPDQALAEQLGFLYSDLETVLAAADVVSIHVPATPATRNMISFAQFECMKDGVVLINTARGSVVDVRAMIEALATGKLAAAGLDVLPEEPTIREEAELLHTIFRKEHDLEALLADHLLLRLRNVYITPHSAFNTREAVQRILSTTVENILAFTRGTPQNVVWQPAAMASR